MLIWLGATAALALVVVGLGYKTGALAVAEGIAGGLLFSIGDISTKLVTDGGWRLLFVIGLVGGYGLGTSLLQLGYQRNGCLDRRRPGHSVHQCPAHSCRDDRAG